MEHPDYPKKQNLKLMFKTTRKKKKQPKKQNSKPIIKTNYTEMNYK